MNRHLQRLALELAVPWSRQDLAIAPSIVWLLTLWLCGLVLDCVPIRVAEYLGNDYLGEPMGIKIAGGKSRTGWSQTAENPSQYRERLVHAKSTILCSIFISTHNFPLDKSSIQWRPRLNQSVLHFCFPDPTPSTSRSTFTTKWTFTQVS